MKNPYKVLKYHAVHILWIKRDVWRRNNIWKYKRAKGIVSVNFVFGGDLHMNQHRLMEVSRIGFHVDRVDAVQEYGSQEPWIGCVPPGLWLTMVGTWEISVFVSLTMEWCNPHIPLLPTYQNTGRGLHHHVYVRNSLPLGNVI